MAIFVSDGLEARKNGGQAWFSVVRRAVKLNVSNRSKSGPASQRLLPVASDSSIPIQLRQAAGAVKPHNNVGIQPNDGAAGGLMMPTT